MALSKITYTDKETLNPLPSVADKNKVTDSDMNEIKSVVNSAIDQVEANTIPQQATPPVSPSENDLWIDTDDNTNLVNIDDTPSTTSTNPIENQAITNYVNTMNEYSTSEVNTRMKWTDGKDIYRKVISTSNAQCQTPGVLVDKSISASSLNISEVIDLKFRVETDLFAGFYNVFGGNDPTNNTRCYYDKVNKNIVIRNGNTGYNSATITMIIEYTKAS